MLVKESSACIDSFDRLGLPTDHKGLNKFTGPKDGGYNMVSNEINAIVQVAPAIVKSRENGEFNYKFLVPVTDHTFQPIGKI